MKKSFIFLTVICMATFLIMPLVALGGPPPVSLSINAGEVCELTETVRMTELTIAEGGKIIAPKGYSLTMTVNGIGTALKPDTYKGKIVLTLTEDIIVQYKQLEPHIFRTAVYVKDGKYVRGKSVAAAATGGKVTNTSTKNIKITSNEEKFNGIIVTGNSRYSISNPKIDFNGNGGNDFAGFGAAIMSDGQAKVTVDKAKITTTGAIRTAVWVGGDSTMTVNDSLIEVNNGILPEDYKFTVEVGKMMEVPWMLGLTGNCRATNLVGNGTANYNNTTIRAQAWGCLSTDDTKKVRLNVKNCTVETIDSGYGAYSIGDSIDVFDGCKINVADIAMIIANGEASGLFTNGTVVNSGRFGVMFHSNQSGTLTIDKGSIFNTDEAVIQVKSSTPTIIIDDAELNSNSSIILQSIKNDDPFMAVMMAGGGPPPSGPDGPPPGGPGGPPPGGPGGPPPGGPGGPPPGGPGGNGKVTATFSNVDLDGDIINGDTASSDMIVSFKSATITGAITTATTSFKYEENGMTAQEFFETGDYSLIGKVTNTYEATNEKFGLSVSLDADSKWIVDKTSYLTELNIEDGAVVDAPADSSVIMTVDDTETPIAAGTYSGKIVLTVE